MSLRTSTRHRERSRRTRNSLGRRRALSPLATRRSLQRGKLWRRSWPRRLQWKVNILNFLPPGSLPCACTIIAHKEGEPGNKASLPCNCLIAEANDITKQKDLSRFHKHLFKQVVSPGGKETPTKIDQDLSSSCSDSREKENKSHREEREDKRGRLSFEGGGRRRSSETEGRSGERVRRRSSETEGRSGERVRRRSSETEGRSGERVRRRSSETEGRSGERVRRRSSETEGRSGERVRRRSSETEGRSGERVRRRSSDRGMEGERRRSSDSRGRDEHYRERRSSNRERRDSHGRRERTPEDRRTKSALNDKTQTSTVEGVGTDEKPSSLPPPIKKMKVRAGIEIEAEEVEPVERRKQAAAKKATEETTQSAKERFLARKRARADAETRKPSVSDEQ